MICAMGTKKAVARFMGRKKDRQERPPRFGRVLSACGFGPTSNWERVHKLSKEGTLRTWMVDSSSDASDGLEQYEAKRVEALKLVEGLEAGGKETWMQLDELLCSGDL